MTGHNKTSLKVVTLKEQKEELAREILVLTRKQQDILFSATPGDMSSLQSLQELLNQRQILIDKINEIDQEIIALNHCNHLYNHENDNRLSEAIAGIEKNIKDIFHQVQKIEINNNSKLNEIMLKLSTDIRSLRTAKKTTRKYITLPGQVQGFFIDKKK